MKTKADFLEQVNKGEANVIAVDFDGVIHSSELGFHDGTIYGTLLPGAAEALKELANKYTVIIYTCKANPERPLINGMTGIELIWEWLESHNLDKFISDITFDKVNASYYIDDKGIRFNNWDDVLKKVL